MLRFTLIEPKAASPRQELMIGCSSQPWKSDPHIIRLTSPPLAGPIERRTARPRGIGWTEVEEIIGILDDAHCAIEASH
ncbi:unnamed protein product [Penicillium camemberti]|uniref:Str. FM013 n=1 Tax=Penicillium camemberti (strain FM 013) TaxID=1429867 RepID=A0A0G4NTT6_PENC3|nr:unnamed protein product [Penicillium camemberti]